MAAVWVEGGWGVIGCGIEGVVVERAERGINEDLVLT